MRSLVKAVHALALLWLIAILSASLVRSQPRSNQELTERQKAVEDKVDRLTNISDQNSGELNQHEKDLEKIASFDMIAKLTEIRTTVSYDHNLIFGVSVAVLVMLLETALRWMMTLKRKGTRNGGAP